MDTSELTTDPDCVFCERIFTGQVQLINERLKVVAFEPLNPVTKGHILVVPMNHSSNAMADPTGAAYALMFATHLAKEAETQANFITSSGEDATQTIMHTHIHMVPRSRDDGLKLPWTDQVVVANECGEPHPTFPAKTCHRLPNHNGEHQALRAAIISLGPGEDLCDWGHEHSLHWTNKG